MAQVTVKLNSGLNNIAIWFQSEANLRQRVASVFTTVFGNIILEDVRKEGVWVEGKLG